MNKYQPKFKPEDYLKFLNSELFDGLYIEPENIIIHYWVNRVLEAFEGNSAEKCLDQAILATGFEKSL